MQPLLKKTFTRKSGLHRSWTSARRLLPNRYQKPLVCCWLQAISWISLAALDFQQKSPGQYWPTPIVYYWNKSWKYVHQDDKICNCNLEPGVPFNRILPLLDFLLFLCVQRSCYLFELPIYQLVVMYYSIFLAIIYPFNYVWLRVVGVDVQSRSFLWRLFHRCWNRRYPI